MGGTGARARGGEDQSSAEARAQRRGEPSPSQAATAPPSSGGHAAARRLQARAHPHNGRPVRMAGVVVDRRVAVVQQAQRVPDLVAGGLPHRLGTPVGQPLVEHKRRLQPAGGEAVYVGQAPGRRLALRVVPVAAVAADGHAQALAAVAQRGRRERQAGGWVPVLCRDIHLRRASSSGAAGRHGQLSATGGRPRAWRWWTHRLRPAGCQQHAPVAGQPRRIIQPSR